MPEFSNRDAINQLAIGRINQFNEIVSDKLTDMAGEHIQTKRTLAAQSIFGGGDGVIEDEGSED
jgi:hypothetical protein